MENYALQQGALSAQLAKSNINIIRCDEDVIYFEYQFRMKDGQKKWAKTFYVRAKDEDLFGAVESILDMVRQIRIEAENGRE